MHNHATRLAKLEEALGPPLDSVNVLHIIIDPEAPGDMATEAIACGPMGPVHFPREAGETKEQMCHRAERAMGRAGAEDRMSARC